MVANDRRDEPDRLDIDLAELERQVAEKRVQLAGAVEAVTKSQTGAWDELVAKGVAWRDERAFLGWITGPAGKEFLARHRLIEAQAVELYREKRGILLADQGAKRRG